MTDEEKKAIKDCDTIFICLDDVMSEESANYYRKSYLTLTNLIEKQSKEIEELKESHIMTHNKSTNTEKAKIFDVIDNSLDRYIEKKFPVTITKEELKKDGRSRYMEKLITTIIGVIFIIIAYLMGLNQNRKEKEYYQKEYQYYRNEYFYLKFEKCDKTYKKSLEKCERK